MLVGDLRWRARRGTSAWRRWRAGSEGRARRWRRLRATRPRSTSSPSTALAADLERLDAAVRVVAALRLEAIERVELQERALHERRRPRRRPPEPPRRSTLPRAPSRALPRRRPRRARCSASETGARSPRPAISTRRWPPPGASSCATATFFSARLASPELDQALERARRLELLALEHADHPRVRGGVLGGAAASADGRSGAIERLASVQYQRR